MITLRPHQQRGLDALDTNNKGQVIVPTGGGKTLIAIMDAQREVEKNPPRLLLCVHEFCWLNNFVLSSVR